MQVEEEEETLAAIPLPVDLGQRHAFLVALDGPQFGEVIHLESGRELILGRWASADVVLADHETSRRHARLQVDHEGARLTDLGSQNGTWVNGRRIQTAVLADGDRLSMGGHSLLKFVHADSREARYLLQLAEAPRLDPVTGLPRGQVLEKLLLAEFSVARRRTRPVSLLAVGVDALADQLGHHGYRQRDEALLRVACALQATLRKEDQAAVFSGGRVYVLAREADPAGVQALARRIRAAVSRSGFTAGSTAPGITVSVGVATLEAVPARGHEALCAELLEAAWKALCKAQRRGRSKVMVLRLSAPV